ncbi:MAG: VWA domain-containing protein [Terriglobales bacterium]
MSVSCRAALRAWLFFAISCTASAQVLNLPGGGTQFGTTTTIDAIEASRLNFDFFTINSRNPNRTPLESPSGSESALDLKAPGKARREYKKGYEFLQLKDLQAAGQHLEAAIHVYPNFVAAHNALGTTYLDLNQNDKAREEFAKAVALDNHLPGSYLNLGIAQLALKQYPGAEESFRKASSLAPVDLQLAVALAYGEFLNHDYTAVVATANDVHHRPHKGAELVHYFAAGAWEAQNNSVEAQQEMETLLQENPNSPSAGQFREILAQIKTAEAIGSAPALKTHKALATLVSARPVPSLPDASQAQRALQDEREQKQINEAEFDSDLGCTSCTSAVAVKPAVAHDSEHSGQRSGSGLVLRSSVHEVDVFFAATDHGNSVLNLTPANVRVLDDGRPPDRITGFRNELQLPLRLGIIIDTSDSVKDRLPFEQRAASKFLEDLLTNNGDLAFVIGANNSVLLVQDFTSDHSLISHAVSQLAPGGGTALWDAVAFASQKLASHRETQPVARVLVVISDGEDNSSSVALKDAVAGALLSETVIYTVSTKELLDDSTSSSLGDHALRTLSGLTGGASFVPGSVRRLEGSLRDVQQVIRGRYLVTYKPASFESDGRYRKIELTAERDGHQLKIFARRGYYALTAKPESHNSAPIQ